jgi:hypothetical protein
MYALNVEKPSSRNLTSLIIKEFIQERNLTDAKYVGKPSLESPGSMNIRKLI